MKLLILFWISCIWMIVYSSRFESYLKAIDLGSFDYGYTVELTSDGGFIICGETVSSTIGFGNTNVLLSKFDSNGNLTWGRVYGSPGYERGTAVQETSDGGFIFTGYSKLYYSYYENILLTKTDSKGNIEWARIYGSLYDDRGVYVVESVDNNGYVVLSSSKNHGVAVYKTLVTRFNTSGDVQWNKAIGATITRDEAQVIKKLNDQEYVLISETESCVGSKNILVVLINDTGTVLFKKVVGGSDADEPRSICPSQDGENFYISGYTSTTEFKTGTIDAFIIKMNRTGNIEFMSTIGEPGNFPTIAKGCIETEFGGVFVGFRSLISASKTDSIIVSFDHYGNFTSISSLSSSSTHHIYANEVKKLDSSGYIVVGYFNGINTIPISGNDVFISMVKKNYNDDNMMFSTTEGCLWSDVDMNDFIQNNNHILTEYSCPSITIESVSFGYINTITGNFSSNLFFTINTLCKTCFSEKYREENSDDDDCKHPKCFGIWDNETNSCSDHGECIEYNKCSCHSNYYGKFCNISSCFSIFGNDSLNVVCSGNGECIEYNKCLCSTNYFGQNCNITTCNNIFSNESSKVCSTHGKCKEFDKCNCDNHYNGSYCEKTFCGNISSEDFLVCSTHGKCLDYEYCECTNPEIYSGIYCQYFSCFSIPMINITTVCNGHGSCIDRDKCYCQVGYSSSIKFGVCDEWYCSGIKMDSTTEQVCSSRGICKNYDDCECFGGYLGNNCQDWSCGGYDYKFTKLTCNGKGTCISPNKCTCKTGYKGDLCKTNMFYYYIMTPILSLVGISTLFVLFSIFICIVCCCFMFIFIFCVSMCFAFIVVFRQRIGLKKFNKLRNFEIYLKEQELEDDDSIAHIKFNKKL